MDILLEPAKFETFAAYADRHELFDLFERLLSRMLIERPADPLQWMIEALQKPVGMYKERHKFSNISVMLGTHDIATSSTVPSIVMCGPPSCGLSNICERVARAHDAIYISTRTLLQNAIEKQTSMGMQAKPFIEKGQLVPDQVMLSLITQRLQEPDVAAHGYVLEGFPRTKEQAFSMQMKGLIPTHFALVEVPDQVIVDRCVGTRIDPVTKKIYHLTYDPPPRDLIAEGRLIQKNLHQEPIVRRRLSQYRANLNGVIASFKKTLRKFNYPKGIVGVDEEEKALNDILEFIGTKKITRAPRQFKIIIQGLPGSGKTSLAKFVEEKYGFVHVSPRKIIQEEVSSKSVWAHELQQFVDYPENVDRGIMMDLIVKRLKRDDCKTQGWVLEGFPNTKAEADELSKHDIFPNRLIWLRVDEQTCKNRLLNRRFDPITGHPVNLLHLPPELANSDSVQPWPQLPSDTEENIERRMSLSQNLKSEMEEAYSYKKKMLKPVNADSITP
ncbi:Adenylate kinase 8, partial [Blyttiomyces sp. JEL0837]